MPAFRAKRGEGVWARTVHKPQKPRVFSAAFWDAVFLSVEIVLDVHARMNNHSNEIQVLSVGVKLFLELMYLC